MAILRNGVHRGSRPEVRPREPETMSSLDEASTNLALERRRMTDGLLNGTALRRHAESAHQGQVREDCPACVDIQRRASLIKEGKL